MQTTLAEVITVAGVIVTMLTGYVVRDRMLARSISEGFSKLPACNGRDKGEYVRRDDLSDHIVRIEKSVDAMMEEQCRTNERIDKILAAVLKAEK